MSRMLSELLGAKEPWFSQTIHKLEHASGSPNADIRLTAEIEQKARHKLKELGLDPTDTNGQELYQSLQDLVAKHDQFLAKALGATDPTDVEDIIPRLLTVIKTLPVSRSCWALKHSVARRLLKASPPKKVMKQLGYRSIDSMLKRENIAELFAATYLLESPLWLKRFMKAYTQLEPSDFEIRNIEIISLSGKRWHGVGDQFVKKTHHNVIQLKELGAAGLLPLPVKHLKGACITLLALLLHHVNELRLYSTFFKMQQVKPHFGEIIVDVLQNDAHSFAVLAGQPLHWRVLHRYFGRRPGSSALAIFEPHVQLEDLEWRQAETVLYRIEPALKFWEEMDCVGVVHNGKPVSFNLLDNAINYCNGLSYGKQTVSHMQANLWDELYIRYVAQEAFENHIMLQLENNDDFEQVRITMTRETAR